MAPPWKTTTKQLGLNIPVTGHQPASSSPTFTLPVFPTSISFTPQELFGATARCSVKRSINPNVVTAESQAVDSLMSPNVDDITADFQILTSADDYKDFLKSSFAGLVATGLGYLFLDGAATLGLIILRSCQALPVAVLSQISPSTMAAAI
jgi:hypothetical protein